MFSKICFYYMERNTCLHVCMYGHCAHASATGRQKKVTDSL